MKFVYYAKQLWLGLVARSSADYWERRYRAGLSSGSGSYDELAHYKAQVLNEFVREHAIQDVIELGCGDGNQLTLARYPRYLGLDVSSSAVDLCAKRFRDDASKSFLWYDPQRTLRLASFVGADLVVSLDVIYHLLEDETYRAYLRDLFSMSRRFVIIYSSNRDERPHVRHVRHHKFTDDVARDFPQFQLRQHLSNPHAARTFADFYVFEKTSG
ncbi:MAG TPA: class I SAM-dependent methyltransferase [Steroidobacteraceae bacterium]